MMGDQNFDCWYTIYPTTHARAGQTVEVVTRAHYDRVVRHLETQRVEALDVLSRRGVNNYERVQAVGLVLSRELDR